MSAHVLERLSAYLDGELRQEEQAAVREHLGGCAECARELGELATLDDAARALPAEPPPGYFEALPARVRARLEPQRRAPRWPVWSWAAAAALLLAVLTPAVLYRSRAPASLDSEPPAAALPTEPRSADPSALEGEAVVGGALSPETQPSSVPMLAVPESKREAEPQPEFARPPSRMLRQERVAPRPTPAQPMAPPPTVAPEAGSAGAVATPPAVALPAEEESAVDDREVAADTVGSAVLQRRVPESDRPREALRDEAPRKKAVAEGERRNTVAGLAERRSPLAPADALYAQLLAASPPADADAARDRREAWRAFARDHASHAGADEARVRALEAGGELYRLGQDPRDLESLRADAAAYLARPDAAQPDRVRALLEQLKQ
jgi:hypothetical protein